MQYKLGEKNIIAIRFHSFKTFLHYYLLIVLTISLLSGPASSALAGDPAAGGRCHLRSHEGTAGALQGGAPRQADGAPGGADGAPGGAVSGGSFLILYRLFMLSPCSPAHWFRRKVDHRRTGRYTARQTQRYTQTNS